MLTVTDSEDKREDTLRNSLEWLQVYNLQRLSVGTRDATRMAGTLQLLSPGTGRWRSPQGVGPAEENVVID